MLTLTDTAVEKVKSIIAERGGEGGLRISVIGGGCSGFQYQMTLDRTPGTEDKVIEQLSGDTRQRPVPKRAENPKVPVPLIEKRPVADAASAAAGAELAKW